MLELTGRMPKLTRAIIQSPNLCNKFDDDDLKRIGEWCYRGYEKDKQSRDKWEKRNEAGMDLALQVQKSKSFPWQNASNVAFPLITIASMQFHARAYSAIIPGSSVVRYKPSGEDPTGEIHARSVRIGDHMSWQCLEEDDGWEEQHDRLLLNMAIVGSTFVKTYHSASKRHNVSEMVQAKDLVMDYYAKSVEAAQRISHIIPLTRNEMHERIMRGTFRDVSEEAWYRSNPAENRDHPASQNSSDNRTGKTPPYPPDETTPFMCIEQHCNLDLDKDGYAEPYIITFEYGSRNVLRIVTRFDREEDISFTPNGKIISIQPMQYFTKFSFIPSPDGGIYDIGFGCLLGPLNESVNSIINQMIDAGTLMNTAGGFLARGARIRGGPQTFSPFQYNRLDISGEDLQKSILPFPVREPSNVLFQLLVLLVNYTSRISGSTEMLTGENPGQNQPASTTSTVLEQGMQIYNSIFKRVWRSMKHEFQRLYVLNAINLPERSYFGNSKYALRQDYVGRIDWVVPVADPSISSDRERIAKAQFVAERAHMAGGYNVDQAEIELLRAMRVDGVESLYIGVQKAPPPNPRAVVENIKLQGVQLKANIEKMRMVMELQEEHRVNTAKILELQAKAAMEMEQAGGVQTGHQLQAFQLALEAIKMHNEKIQKRSENIFKSLELVDDYRNTEANIQGMAQQSGDQGGPSGGGGQNSQST